MPGYENKFTGFMHQDTEKTYQPKDTYYNLRNCDVIQRSDGSFSIKTAMGTSAVAILERPNWRIIGAVSDGENKIYVHSTGDDTVAGGAGEIGVFTVEFNSSKVITVDYEPLYYHDDLLYSVEHPIARIAHELVFEGSEIGRLRWSDYYNKPRTLNVLSNKILTSLNGYGLTEGKKYQVVKGTATYNGTVYGPDEAAGNVFTVVSGVYNISASSSMKLIEHIDVADLAWSPSKGSGEIYCSGFGTGNIYCGTYIALYSLISSEGYESPYSYSSLPIFVGAENISTTDTQTYHEYQGAQSEINSNKSLILQINDIDTDYERIKIVLIKFIGENLAETPRVYENTLITGSEMEIEITGAGITETVPVEELKAVLNNFEKVGTFTTNKNRAIVGDVTLTDGLENWNPGNVGYEFFDYETPSDDVGHDGKNATSHVAWAGHAAAATNIASGDIKAGSWYEVDGTGTIRYPAGTGTVYSVGQYFQGQATTSGSFEVVDSTYDSVSGSPTVHAVIRVQNFNGNYRYYRLSDDFYDMKGIVASHVLKSLKRGGEKYRWGIMPISNEGSPMFVHWLFDTVTPEIKDGFPLTKRYYKAAAIGDEVWNTKHMGIRIGTTAKPLDLSYLDGKASAVCIVRATRIPKCIAQGLQAVVVNSNDSASRVNTETSIYLGDDGNFNPTTVTNGGAIADYLTMLFSPEYHFNHSQVSGKTENLKAKIVSWLGDENGSGHDNATYRTMRMFNTNDLCHYWKYHDMDYSSHSTDVPGTIVDIKELAEAEPANQDIVEFTGLTKAWNRQSHIETDTATRLSGEGITGKGTLLYHDKEIRFGDPGKNDQIRALIDIIDLSNENPDYGNPDENEYILCGHILKLDDATRTANGGNFIFDGIEVFGGDVFVNIYNCQKSIAVSSIAPNAVGSGSSLGLTVSFPVESVINVAFRRGRHGYRDGNYSSTYTTNGVYYTRPENFIIDGHYLSETDPGYSFAHVPESFIADNRRLYSVFFSEAKIIGESIDAYRRFPAANERFMEIGNGPVKALMNDQGRLFCWQTNGVLYLPMEEASTISSDVGSAVLIGVSGVIDRFEERSGSYGLQERHSLIAFADGFLWCDVALGEIIYMSSSGAPGSLSIIKGLGNKIKNYLRGSDIQADPENSNPLTGTGISVGYESRYDRIFMTFLTGLSSSIQESFTIEISALAKAFVSIRDFTPPLYIEHADMLFAAPPCNYPVYTSPGLGTSAGQVLRAGHKFIFVDGSGNSTIYRVNDDYVTTGSETTPYSANKISRLGNLEYLWMFESQTSSNFNLAKFFGEVMEEEIHVIVNVAPDVYKKFKAFQLNGNSGDNNNSFGEIISPKHSYVQFITEEHSSPIDGTTNHMKFKRGSWFGYVLQDRNFRFISPSLSDKKRRMRGRYMEIILTHDHRSEKSTTTTGVLAYADLSDQKAIKLTSIFTTFDEDVAQIT